MTCDSENVEHITLQCYRHCYQRSPRYRNTVVFNPSINDCPVYGEYHDFCTYKTVCSHLLEVIVDAPLQGKIIQTHTTNQFISSVCIPMLEPSFKDKKPWDKKVKGHHEGGES